MSTRHISTPWNRLVCPVSFTPGGVGTNGLTVSLTIQRRSDGYFFNSATPAWQAGVAVITVPQPDLTNLPGYYEYSMDPTYLDRTAGYSGYVLKFVENSTNLLEYVDVTCRASEATISERVWTEDLETEGFIDSSANDTIAANLLWRLIEAVINPWLGTTPSITKFTANANGVSGKFYHAAGPVVGDSGAIEGVIAIHRPFGGGSGDIATLVRVTEIGNDGADYFTLTGFNGVALSATTTNDELILLQGHDFPVEELMAEGMASAAATGTYKDVLKRMLGLRQSNMRLIQTAWNAAGAVTAGYVLVYASASDANSDADPWPLATGRYDFTASYDGSLRLTEYVSTRTS